MIRFFPTPLSLGNNILRTQCNIVVAKQHIICRKATSFIEDNIILCPLERNDDDRRRSNSVLATLAIVLCPYGHNHQKEKVHKCVLFLFGSPCWARTNDPMIMEDSKRSFVSSEDYALRNLPLSCALPGF